MNILVLGDSTSFGAELLDLPVKDFGKYGNDYLDDNHVQQFAEPSQLAWPALLGKKLKCNIENQSMVGGSNDRIFRLAITETLNKSWDLVICAWTAVDRFDLTDGQHDLALAMTNHWGYSWIKEYVINHCDLQRQNINFATKLVALQSYFKQKDQCFVFVKSTAMQFTNDVDQLINSVDKTNWIDWNSHFYQWTKHLPQKTNGHLNETAHEMVANIMYDNITRIYPHLQICF